MLQIKITIQMTVMTGFITAQFGELSTKRVKNNSNFTHPNVEIIFGSKIASRSLNKDLFKLKIEDLGGLYLKSF